MRRREEVEAANKSKNGLDNSLIFILCVYELKSNKKYILLLICEISNEWLLLLLFSCSFFYNNNNEIVIKGYK